VYGGGGIMPDIYVPADTSYLSDYLSQVFRNNLVNQFGFDYADQHREALSTFGEASKFQKQFQIDGAILNNFVKYAEENGVEEKPEQLAVSKTFLSTQVKAVIARHIYGDDGYYRVIHEVDPTRRKAILLMQAKESILSQRLQDSQ
jgi:carboxyl-terminal processing protease